MSSKAEHPDLEELLVKRGRRPLTSLEERLLFLAELEPGNAAYNLPAALRFRGALDTGVLRRAFEIVINRDSAFRTSFGRVDGIPVATRQPAQPPEWESTDLGHLEAAEALVLARSQLHLMARRPFHLDRPPLIRVALFRISDDDHLMGCVTHHICSDGWSVAMLLREIGTTYDRLRAGSILDDAHTRDEAHVRTVLAERRWVRDKGPEALSFWRAELADAPHFVEFFLDRPRDRLQDGGGDFEAFRVGPVLSARVDEACRRAQVTKFVFFLAAFGALLQRYTLNRDLLVGVPVANRRSREAEGLIGAFVNTVPVRLRLDAAAPFVDLLRATQASWHTSVPHQPLPFGVLVDALQPQRDPGVSPLVQLCFTYQNVRLEGLGFTDLEVVAADGSPLSFNSLEVRSGTAKFDLSLSIEEAGGEIVGQFEYSTGTFDEADAIDLRKRFLEVVAAATEDVSAAICDLLLEPETSPRRLMGAAALDSPSGRNVPELIWANLARMAESPAIVAGDVRVSYGQLADRTARVAQLLSLSGVGPGDRVGVRVRRSADLYAVILAVWQCGAAFVPFDENHPDAYVAKILEQGKCTALVAEVPVAGVPDGVIALAPSDSDQVAPAPLTVAYEFEGAAEAYVLFTSGSTGRAKGVIVTHGNLASAAAAWVACYGLDSGPLVHLQFASPAFDVFTGDLVRALAYGGSLVVTPQELLGRPADLLAFLRSHRAEFAEFVPSVLVPLARYADSMGERLGDLGIVVAGSEAISVPELAMVRRVCQPSTRVFNSYGITETTIDNFLFEMVEDTAGLARLPIGRPLSNTAAAIIDAFGRSVPDGLPGELLILGPCVSLGYLDEPELTSKSFCDGGVVGSPGVRGFKTGDLVRRRRDGNLEFLGRRDAQLKRRGVRLEPEAIEAALRDHRSVGQAGVVMHGGGVRLVAFVAPSGTIAPNPTTLRGWLRERLPITQCPDLVAVVERIPLTVSGKIDRLALSELPLSQPAIRPLAPGDETVLAAIWSGLLATEVTGADADFFALGGHSLLLGQLAVALQDSFGCEIGLRELLFTSGLAEQAALVARLRAAGPTMGRAITAAPRSRSTIRVSRHGRIGDPSPFTTGLD